MKGPICLITGATSGIGKATAFELASRGATVVVVGRNRQKCARTVEQIIQDTGNPSVRYLVADLSSQNDIRILTENFKSQYSRLDVLVNNAGTIAWSRQLSPDGIELTFALNHLGYYLLTNLLLDVLISSAPSRVINVSSAAHLGAEIDFEDIQNSKKYSGLRAYGRSKLANLMFTYALARRLEGTGVTANALHPGLVATNLPANGKMLFGWVIGPILRSFLTIAGKSKAKGCQTVVYLATAREVANITGRYLVDESETKSSDASNDTEAADRLWELSSQLTGFSSSNKRTGGG